MKRVISCIVLGMTVFLAAGGLWVRHVLRTPVNHGMAGQYVQIPKGSSPLSVIKKLKGEGVVRNEWPLLIYLKLTGAGSRFKAGEYDFSSPISPLGVIEKLQQGEQRLVRLTIVEGWSRWDIAEAMAGVPELGLEDAQAALALMNNVGLIRDLEIDADNLEGYLYPATYEFAPNTKPEELIGMMVERFKSVWKPDQVAAAAMLNLSMRQIVTVASLIETEAKLPNERPLIASVIYNRLQKEIPLGVDSSVIYGAKVEGKWRNDGKVYRSDIERRSPYNTRIHLGLPPGPIASPGESSIMAALNPAQTDYIYYVREPSRNDGAHNFYVNEKEFAAGVEALRKWERERDAQNAKRKSEEVHLQH